MSKIDMANKWLTAAQSVVVIVGLVFTVWQVRISAQANAATQETTSAQYVLDVGEHIGKGTFQQINRTIGDGSSTTKIIKKSDGGNGGPYRIDDVDDYLSQLDDVAILVRDKVITPEMAFNNFSIDVEKAWCNNDIRVNLIFKSRKLDTSATATTSPYYGYFEWLAKHFLSADKQKDCSWVDRQ